MGRIKPFNYVSRSPAADCGVNDAWDVVTVSRARRGTTLDDSNPFLVANEWIASSVGQFLRLGIPPFALLRRGHERVLFASLHFGRDAAPDDIDPAKCWAALPEECTGTLLFDILIGNSDRHDGNLKVDDPEVPNRLFVYDHDHSLFGAMPGDELKRLESLEGRLGVTGGSVSHGNRNILLDVVNTKAHFEQWLKDIEAMPDTFLRRMCREVIGFGITAAQADAVCDFLIARKNSISELIFDNRHEFRRIPQAEWGLFKP